MSKLLNAHMAAAKYLLRLPGPNDGFRHHIQANGFKLTEFVDAN